MISTGPYGIVRHPMYAGAMLVVLATPPALGSLWAHACAVLLCGIIVAQLLDEERYLTKHLPGYEAYCREVRHHLNAGSRRQRRVAGDLPAGVAAFHQLRVLHGGEWRARIFNDASGFEHHTFILA